MKHPDISHYNKIVDKDKFYSQCDFVIVKAVQGTKLEENHNKESVAYLKTAIKECERRKKPYWLYVFLDRGHEVAQAKFLVKVCSSLIGKYFVGYVLDIESQNDEDGCIKALAYIKKHSKKQMIYTMYSQYSKYKRLIAGRGARCAWWEARYGENINKDTSDKYPCHIGVDLHQYTSKGKMNAIEGDIDLNRLTGSKSINWFTGAKSKPNRTTSKATRTYTGVLPDPKKYIKFGSRGTNVKCWQKFLQWRGYKLSIDGIFGSDTRTCTKKFQTNHGLDADGIVGPKTVAKAKTVKK